jgi:hypothetical protein
VTDGNGGVTFDFAAHHFAAHDPTAGMDSGTVSAAAGSAWSHRAVSTIAGPAATASVMTHRPASGGRCTACSGAQAPVSVVASV